MICNGHAAARGLDGIMCAWSYFSLASSRNPGKATSRDSGSRICSSPGTITPRRGGERLLRDPLHGAEVELAGAQGRQGIDLEETVLVLESDVAGDIPAVAQDGRRQVVAAQVAAHDVRALDQHQPGDVRPERVGHG